MRAILDLILLILQLYTWVVIATAIMSWLIAFDVVNFRSDFVRAVWNTLDALTEPVLRPIRTCCRISAASIFRRSYYYY